MQPGAEDDGTLKFERHEHDRPHGGTPFFSLTVSLPTRGQVSAESMHEEETALHPASNGSEVRGTATATFAVED